MLKSEEALRLIRILANSSGSELLERKVDSHIELTVKISIDSNQQPAAPPARQDPDRRLRVLHVEDLGRAGDLIHYYLRGKYDVSSAADAEEALKLALEEPFDFVLMDMNLGERMSGFELTRMFRRIGHYTKIPIVAITGYTSKKDIERCIAAGCSAYLAKPFLKEDLLRVLSELTPA